MADHFDDLFDPEKFDHLDSVRGRAHFISTVVDYVQYLKTESADTTPQRIHNATERKVAEKFILLVKQNEAWPFARQVIPEFRSCDEPAVPISKLFQFVLRGLSERREEEQEGIHNLEWDDEFEEVLGSRRADTVLSHLMAKVKYGQERAEKLARDMEEAKMKVNYVSKLARDMEEEGAKIEVEK